MAEQKLRQSEERYRTLAKNFPNGAVLLFDHQLRHTIADGTGLAPMNLSKETLEGQTLWDVFPSDIAQQLEPYYRTALNGQPDSVELSMSDRIYLFQFTPLTDRQGDCFAGMVTTQDITKYKRVEQDIRNALEKEKQLNELKSRFITMASHEFRTPLATILGSSEILRYFGQKCSEEKRLKHYTRIQSGVDQMTRLLDDVLMIGRAEAGRLPFQPIAIDIVAFCTNLTEELQLSIADKKTVAINLQFSPPAIAGTTATIQADEQLLRQILTNLLSNAIKYSHPGNAIDFSIILEEGAAIFTVRDRGIGIPQEDIPHLFEQFHRAANVGTTQGTGLGLSIVKKSIELHGGSIQVSSVVNQGTTFSVTLPRQPLIVAAASDDPTTDLDLLN
jgi:signal transduction histidine kinase